MKFPKIPNPFSFLDFLFRSDEQEKVAKEKKKLKKEGKKPAKMLLCIIHMRNNVKDGFSVNVPRDSYRTAYKTFEAILDWFYKSEDKLYKMPYKNGIKIFKREDIVKIHVEEEDIMTSKPIANL